MLLLMLLTPFYLVVIFLLQIRWLPALKRDVHLPASEKWLGLLVVVFCTTFWFFIVPFAYLELLDKKLVTTRKFDEG